MNEKNLNNFEGGQESIPTPEQVREIFDRLIGEGKYEDRRKLEDEQGLYLWEAVVLEKDEDGCTSEYSYIRAGRYSEGGQSSETAIHITYFDEEGIPIGGESVAKYKNGEWHYYTE